MPGGDESGRVLGRYVLHHELASGGMATVYLGSLHGALGFHRVVAIKRMKPLISADSRFRSMFVDEARLAAHIQHPNVVATLDVVAEAEELFIVMEYVRGQSLSQLRRLGTGGIAPRIAVSIMMQVLAGLHAAHEARDQRGTWLEMIHRDVSPQSG